MHTILSVCKVMFASVSIKHNEQYKNKTIISKKQIHFLNEMFEKINISLIQNIYFRFP